MKIVSENRFSGKTQFYTIGSRRTPPKDDLSALVDECNQLASKFREELVTIDNDNLKDLNKRVLPEEVPSVPRGVPGRG